MPNPQAALAYAERHELHALLIERGGEIVHESYGERNGRDTPHPLYSGAKSFWGVAAVAAQCDGLLSLDERVAETVPEWQTGRKATVTLRMLLDLTAGIGFGGLGNAVPPYDRALGTDLKNEPGTKFTYGGIPLQIFGAVLARKLRTETPHDYLRRRILEPASVAVAKWRTLADGTQPLPTGAFLTARNWLAYGRYVCRGAPGSLPKGAISECFTGSAANPRYGLGWWLAPKTAPEGTFYASGAGGQALYVIPAEETIVVHFGKSNSWSHDAFLRKLLS
jgi:CubicO group peptidase (beta-lactamase class C family)